MGARVSMRVGGTVVLLSGVAGVLIGGLAGYAGGKLDIFVTVIVIDSLMAFPGILLAIALVAFLGPGLDRLIFALVIIGWVGYARLARGQVLKIKTLEFVEAARALGASSCADFFSACPAEHRSAGAGSGQYRDGDGGSGGSIIKFSGSWDSSSGAELGSDAQ